ncbi:PRC-barrel domain-containing protein [Phycicoccus endophyticus]|uniref:PRC-barrel domain-containing protein n=1 Tax=Phycicoccus endophyticus TaxID=1690220 RepID=A0A7G9R0N4_9MICO|nr:PRC-barrel domain-containing protein [Phycicoccus endophyticus]NHI19440.1 hypothetical protein [Phycicoccus endophyticus]QNN49159.1 PRC-barrel domain-containing protein [Phycicoccus endophyticus]GGL39200.1 hypothetical protein GCM10012283_22090 [Phycicoccus endophyticus]
MTPAHRTMAMRHDVLDRQVVDSEGRPVGRVDDVELDEDGAAVALRVGMAALAPRLGGWVGQLLGGLAHRLAEGEPSPAVPVERVTKWSPLVHLDVPVRELDGVAGLEGWLGTRVVGRLPGGGDARV